LGLVQLSSEAGPIRAPGRTSESDRARPTEHDKGCSSRLEPLPQPPRPQPLRSSPHLHPVCVCVCERGTLNVGPSGRVSGEAARSQRRVSVRVRWHGLHVQGHMYLHYHTCLHRSKRRRMRASIPSAGVSKHALKTVRSCITTPISVSASIDHTLYSV